ncbi:MAG: MFS transporter [Deltaproteobacteria bacterium]|jgi:predicted MFS family arabinose efflux permease|nr:MFS transporter [Deltaproteobacteria bacterium]
MPHAPDRRPSLGVLFSVVVTDLIGFGIVVPILPFWAERYGANGAILGLLLTSHAAMQFVFAPRWGRLSDRIGRRPVMLMTIAGTALALLALGFAESLITIFVARIFSGIFGSNVSVATAYLTDVTDEQERTRWMGMIGASFAVGFTLGPPIGGLLSPLGHGVPMFFAAGLSLLNLVWAGIRLVEPSERQASGKSEKLTSRLDVLRDPAIRRICLVYFLFSLAVTQLETVFAFFMSHRFGYDELGVAMVMFAMAVVMGAIQGGGMKRLAARWNERRLVVAGLSLMALAFACLPLPGSVALLMAPLMIASVGRGISQPPLMSLASLGAAAGTHGIVMGVFQSSASAARVVGPVIAGSLYDRGQPLPFWLAALLVATAGGLALTLHDRPSVETAEPVT